MVSHQEANCGRTAFGVFDVIEVLEPEAIDRIPIDSFGGSIDLQESNLNIRQIWALETAFYSDDH